MRGDGVLLMSNIERKYCSITTSYLTGFFAIFHVTLYLTDVCVF